LKVGKPKSHCHEKTQDLPASASACSLDDDLMHVESEEDEIKNLTIVGLPAKTLKMLNRSATNLKRGKVSAPIDLSLYQDG
jgi:hypothetical protein